MKHLLPLLIAFLIPQLALAAVPTMACRKVQFNEETFVGSFFAVADVVDLAPGQSRREARQSLTEPINGMIPMMCFGYEGSADPKKLILELTLWQAPSYASFGGFSCDESNTDNAILDKIQRKELTDGESIQLQMPSTSGTMSTFTMLRIMTDDEYQDYLNLGGNDVTDESIEYLDQLCEQYFD